MKAGKQFSRSALAAMIAIAVAAPAAGAMPAQDGQAYDVNSVTGEYTRATAGQDKNATTAAGATPAREGQAYDVNSLTGEYTRATAEQDKHQTPAAGSDLRTEGAKSPIVSRIDTPPLGLPTWEKHPTPIVTAAPEPVAATDGGDGSFDWPLAGLIAGGLIALAGAALLTRHQMRGQAPAH